MPEPTPHAHSSDAHAAPRADDAGGRAARAPLFQTARGLVSRCACCERLELRFGNALLALGADELPHVLASLGDAEQVASGRREATLFLGESGCGWVFSGDELAELHRLVAGARLMLDLGGA